MFCLAVPCRFIFIISLICINTALLSWDFGRPITLAVALYKKIKNLLSKLPCIQPCLHSAMREVWPSSGQGLQLFTRLGNTGSRHLRSLPRTLLFKSALYVAQSVGSNKKKDSNFFYSSRGFRIHLGELKSFQARLLPSRLNRCALQARSSVAILSVSLLLVQACLLPSRLKPLCASGRRTFELPPPRNRRKGLAATQQTFRRCSA